MLREGIQILLVYRINPGYHFFSWGLLIYNFCHLSSSFRYLVHVLHILLNWFSYWIILLTWTRHDSVNDLEFSAIKECVHEESLLLCLHHVLLRVPDLITDQRTWSRDSVGCWSKMNIGVVLSFAGLLLCLLGFLLENLGLTITIYINSAATVWCNLHLIR